MPNSALRRRSPRAATTLVLALALLGASSGPRLLRPSDDPPLATVTAGEGTPVVIVPGMLGSAYGFRKVIPELVTAGFRVTVVDPLGFGASPAPDGADYSFTAQATRIAQTVERQGRGKVILVCHALSSSICLRLGYRRPDLVRGIISINGGPAEQTASSDMRFALKFARIVLAIAGRGFAVHKVRDGLIGSSSDPSWVTDSVLAQYIAPFGPDPRRVVRRLQLIAAAHEADSLRPNLPRVEAPVVLLLGLDERKSKGPSLDADERATLRAGLRRYDEDGVAGAGEYLQEEQPGRVVEAVKKMREKTS